MLSDQVRRALIMPSVQQDNLASSYRRQLSPGRLLTTDYTVHLRED
jgi:hypothetical protein